VGRTIRWRSISPSVCEKYPRALSSLHHLQVIHLSWYIIVGFQQKFLFSAAHDPAWRRCCTGAHTRDPSTTLPIRPHKGGGGLVTQQSFDVWHHAVGGDWQAKKRENLKKSCCMGRAKCRNGVQRGIQTSPNLGVWMLGCVDVTPPGQPSLLQRASTARKVPSSISQK